MRYKEFIGIRVEPQIKALLRKKCKEKTISECVRKLIIQYISPYKE